MKNIALQKKSTESFAYMYFFLYFCTEYNT